MKQILFNLGSMLGCLFFISTVLPVSSARADESLAYQMEVKGQESEVIASWKWMNSWYEPLNMIASCEEAAKNETFKEKFLSSFKDIPKNMPTLIRGRIEPTLKQIGQTLAEVRYGIGLEKWKTQTTAKSECMKIVRNLAPTYRMLDLLHQSAYASINSNAAEVNVEWLSKEIEKLRLALSGGEPLRYKTGEAYTPQDLRSEIRLFNYDRNVHKTNFESFKQEAIDLANAALAHRAE